MSPITGFCSYSLGMVAPWTPASLGSALRGWYIADTGVTTSSGNVTAVADQSGNGFNLANNGTVPFNATGFNGKPTFSFLAANAAWLQTTANAFALGATTGGSFFGVGQMLTATAANGGAVVYGNGASNDFNSGAACAACVVRDASNNNLVSTRNGVNTNVAAMSLATNHRFGYIADASGNGTTYVDNVAGGAAVNQVAASSLWTSPGTLVIGTRYLSGAPSGANPWEGPISEIVVTNTALSSADRSNLDTYFRNKWGI